MLKDDMSTNIDKLLAEIKKRYKALWDGSCKQKDYLNHIRSLAGDMTTKYIIPSKVKFEKCIPIAFAVCNKECGYVQLIVEGGTQECQFCGGLMYRVKTKLYEECKNKKRRKKRKRPNQALKLTE
jgi:hypothetical protein